MKSALDRVREKLTSEDTSLLNYIDFRLDAESELDLTINYELSKNTVKYLKLLGYHVNYVFNYNAIGSSSSTLPLTYRYIISY